jgi:hypothetical protein
MDQYVCISESTPRDSRKHFDKTIWEVYDARCLKKLTREDLLPQMEINRHQGGQECLFHWIACIMYERIVQQFGKNIIKTKIMKGVLY